MNAKGPRFTLLMTGAGGVAAPGLIAHLQHLGVRVLAADMNRHASGLVLADRGFCIPAARSPEFVPVMRQICASEHVDVLVPLVDEELGPVQELAGPTLRVLTPRPAFIDLCLDKHRLGAEFTRHGLPHPRSCRGDEDVAHLRFPVILKPRTGRGSRGVERIDSLDAFRERVRRLERPAADMVVQEYIDGPEFTVSVVVWRDGEVQAVVPKEIIAKRGITQAAVTRRHAGIDTLCRRIQHTFRADGPFNVQLRLHPESGEPLPFEINPRYSTTVTHTMAAGIDELYGLACQAVHGREAHRFGTWTENLVLRRRSVDEFLPEAAWRDEQANRIWPAPSSP